MTSSFPRKILVAVVGMSPQIVTETIWALMHTKDFVPTEVHLITTRNGRNRAVRDLLHTNEGRFHAFCQEYDLVGKIRFDESSITVITDQDGEPLDDIRTPEENSLAADTIVRTIGSFCADEHSAVHVSIAGGRKSMGFFAGYAMSLFARAQDSVSHVLVNEPFESNRDFFYPPAAPQDILSEGGTILHTSEAKVMLADIPIVRLRMGLPDDLLSGVGSYGLAVEEAQRSLFPDRRLVFHPERKEVVCNGTAVQLPPAPFTVLYWLARRCCAGLPPVRPGNQSDANEFFALYEALFPSRLGDIERARTATRAEGDFLHYFQEKRSQINKRLTTALGQRRAEPYLVGSSGKRPFVAYALSLKPGEIAL